MRPLLTAQQLRNPGTNNLMIRIERIERRRKRIASRRGGGAVRLESGILWPATEPTEVLDPVERTTGL
jgi:hypothetical protein